jgi:thiol-disulfide isomerase/thioredoxin
MKKSLLNIIILLCVLAFCGIINYWLQHRMPNTMMQEKRAQGQLVANDYRPENFTYKTLSGKKGSFYALENKVVMIHLWATWCPPCVTEFPDLMKLATAKQDNFVILAISMDNNKNDIEKFIQKTKIPLPANMKIIFDKENDIPKDFYGNIKLPESYIFTQGLNLSRTIKGPQENWNSDEWHNTIQLFYDLPY